MTHKVWIGWDPTEIQASVVAQSSAKLNSSVMLDVERLALIRLRAQGFYTRPTEDKDGHLWDVLSEAPMSTEHAISRFFVPLLEGYQGLALFMDGDVLIRGDLKNLFALADPQYAVMVVKHPEGIQGGATKKDGHVQTIYPRKNWSSVILFNCGHPSNMELGLSMLNTLPGRDLHRFCWLKDEEIGELPSRYNYLIGVTNPPTWDVDIAHFTLGLPPAPDSPMQFAQEWWDLAKSCGYDPVVVR